MVVEREIMVEVLEMIVAKQFRRRTVKIQSQMLIHF